MCATRSTKLPALSTIDGVPPSTEVRARLLDSGETVLLAFSRGKDSIAVALALMRDNIPFRPFYRYSVPRLRMVEESLTYFEDFFGQPILRVIHPSMLRKLDALMMQPPQRCRVIDFAGVEVLDYRQSNDLVCKHFGLDPKTTWICDGVRASDTTSRRRALSMYGAWNDKEMHCHPVWDWKEKHVWHAIDEAGIKHPPDYRLFGRSLDGLDYRYLAPLRREYPDDFDLMLRWYPQLKVEFLRRENLSRKHPNLKTIPWRTEGGTS